MTDRPVLDPCCGHRSFWFDSANPAAVFGDVRQGEWELCDGRAFDVSPDEIMDFTDMPFADATFSHVVFDPPHLVRAGEASYMAIKYGRLEDGWQASGPVHVVYDLDDRTADYSMMYDGVDVRGGTILYCQSCGKRLGRVEDACDFREDG